MSLQDKVAIVTGGSSGIGFGISKKLVEEGAKVYILARTESTLQEASEELNARGDADWRSVDVTNFDTFTETVDEIHDEEGLDIFVNNAGVYKPSSVDDDVRETSYLLDVLFKYPYMINRYLANEYENVHIQNISSHAALRRDLPGGLEYSSAKTALSQSTMHLKDELERENRSDIDITQIYPASVATESVMPLIKKGKIDKPTTVDSIANTSYELLTKDTPTDDVFVGYARGKGIVRRYLDMSPENNNPFENYVEDIIDPTYTPNDLL